MKYVVLADGTRIENCSDSTTSTSIFPIRSSYGEAAAVRDTITALNGKNVRVYDENNQMTTSGADLVLIEGVSVHFSDGVGYVAEISLRNKTRDERIDDQIAELQEAVIG